MVHVGEFQVGDVGVAGVAEVADEEVAVVGFGDVLILGSMGDKVGIDNREG